MLVAEAGGSKGTQRKKRVRRWKSITSNGVKTVKRLKRRNVS
jgi:hypothetical protein